MGKHSSEKTKKKVNKFNILLALLLIVSIIIIVSLIINKSTAKDEKDIVSSEVTNVINKAFSALKEAKVGEAKKYMDYEQLIGSLDESILSKENSEEASNIEKRLFNRMSWSIENVKVSGNEAQIVVEVTNIDFNNVVSDWLGELIEKKENEVEISSEIYLQMLEEILTKDNIKEKTVIKKITLRKQDEEWKIIVNDNLRDLVFSGIENIINEVDS